MPLLIGIGGGSASGKSFLAERLAEQLKRFEPEIIHTDHFFQPVKPKMVSRFSGKELDDFNQEASWDLARFREEFERAAAGGRKVVIIEGIFALYCEDIRNRFDLTVFVDTPSDERFYRRIKRRMALGVTLEDEADYFLGTQRFRHLENYEPLKAHADIVVNGSDITSRKVDVIAAWITSRLIPHQAGEAES